MEGDTVYVMNTDQVPACERPFVRRNKNQAISIVVLLRRVPDSARESPAVCRSCVIRRQLSRCVRIAAIIRPVNGAYLVDMSRFSSTTAASAVGSAEYRSTHLKRFPRIVERETAEGRYWKRFKHPVVERKDVAITHIQFCPSNPYDYAVTASTRVYIYSCRKNKPIKVVSRFQSEAYSGVLRSDGKVLAAGGKTPVVKIFQADNKSLLRMLEGHERPVTVVKWAPSKKHVFSCSDDHTSRFWDISQGKCTATFQGHNDYVRCADTNPNNPDTWATGSMDTVVKLWDTRSPNSAIMEMKHGDPVNSVLFLPGGGLCLSAGGNTVKVWDILGGGRLVTEWSNHQKTITTMCLDGTSSRILTGGLDGHVKIHDVKTYEVAHGLKYDKPILSMAVAPDNSRLVVGMVDGTLSVRNREMKIHHGLEDYSSAASEAAAKEVGGEEIDLKEVGMLKRHEGPRLFGGTFKFLARGKNAKAGEDDYLVEVRKKKRLQPYDKLLKQFNHRGALDAVLATRHPAVVASMLEELVARGALNTALSGRDDVALEPIMSFLIKYISNPRYSKLLICVCTELIGIYSDVLGQSPSIDNLIFKLNARVKEELALQTSMLKLIGALDIVLAQGQVQ